MTTANMKIDYHEIGKIDVPRNRGRMEPYAKKLTSQQEQQWTETRTLLLMSCPAFSHLLYTMMNPKGRSDVAFWTEDIPIAATDGVTLMLNPNRFFTYNLKQRVFIVAHEICHCMFNHCGMGYGWNLRGKVGYVDGTFLDYYPKLMNVAMDLVINDLLKSSNIGEFSTDWLHDINIATLNDSVVTAYRKVYEQCPKVSMSGGGKGDKDDKGNKVPGIKGEGFDEHLNPGAANGEDPTAADQARSEQEWKTAIAAAAASARVQGKLPAGLERLFGELLNPKVDWREHIQSFFARKVGSGGYDWRRPERRMITREVTGEGKAIYAPRRSGYGAGTIVIGGDTSGSISYKPGEIGDVFLCEIAGILEMLNPKRIVVMWCDADVNRVDEVEEASDIDAIRHKGAPGGGGTDFRPVFDEIVKMGLEPDCLVYLTDGYGSFPDHAPSYPMVWGSITDVKYPFGEVVKIDVD